MLDLQPYKVCHLPLAMPGVCTGATAAAHAVPISDGAEAIALAGTAPDGAPWLELVTITGGKVAAEPQQRVAGLTWASAGGAAVAVATLAVGAGSTDAPSAAEAGIKCALTICTPLLSFNM